MSKNNFKCNQCGEKCDYLDFPIRGLNNAKLCHDCGKDTCFDCGKKETPFRWIEEGKDCRGNKIMTKVMGEMFSQREKEDNNLEKSWNVYYCDEHKNKGQEKPNKWTEEDNKVWYEKRQKEERERIAKEKQEIEEKLNSQKNLFRCEGRSDENKEGVKYASFLGMENGQKYYLMVPVDHPITKQNDPAIKKILNNIFWSESEDFFVLDGVENIPIEESPLGYWKYWEPTFHKIVGLDDKITIAEYKEERPEKEPGETLPVSNSQSPELNNKVLWIVVGGISGALIIAFLVGLWLSKKRKK
ncbi:protein of unknown function [endosymbiont DhMRE of Dentiscutata heterogama]|uniref:hypothetical protein n=1 Tax=endosymbiont DhMRE of Dentiscutata heterogama TaxID=1609546 RepID=UPI000629D893|nr:hypothetical protein [endosymbiont DhMRE of Dentiscutata heterogama]CFW92791.1 protein of unknown function [endosymbiont DhMRE of Dentiscutata heterogama]